MKLMMNEDGEGEMKRRFCTTICQTPGIAYNTNKCDDPSEGRFQARYARHQECHNTTSSEDVMKE